ncbi:MAG TPA: GNAT family N-acetyltransferase [Bacillota bacterium]|nr:GNAT family N-acetyltransferase [Bacillota bacterium]
MEKQTEKDLFVLGRLQPQQVEQAGRLVAENPVFRPYQYTAKKIADLLFDALQTDDVILTALDCDQLRGLVWLQPKNVFGLSAYIKLIAVDFRYHQHGIGRFLMTAAELLAQETSPNLFILTSVDNLTAQQFYLRLGYEAIGVIKDFVYDNVDELLMRKTWGSIRGKNIDLS